MLLLKCMNSYRIGVNLFLNQLKYTTKIDIRQISFGSSLFRINLRCISQDQK